jgi:hypothetical protein
MGRPASAGLLFGSSPEWGGTSFLAPATPRSGGFRRRPSREGEGHFLLMARPFKSQEVTLAFTTRPVRIIWLGGRRARSCCLRCLRLPDPDLGAASSLQTCRVKQVPSLSHGTSAGARSFERVDVPSRPAWKKARPKGNAARRRVWDQACTPAHSALVPLLVDAKRLIPLPVIPVSLECSHIEPAKRKGFGPTPKRQPLHVPAAAMCAREPTPAAGRIGLSVWPPSTLASKARRRVRRNARPLTCWRQSTRLASPRGQRERCRALV